MPATATATVTLTNPTGLHARPAKVFAKAVAGTGHDVTVTKGDTTVDGRSTLSVLTLDCHQGDQVTISVEGERADAVLAELVALVESGLGEGTPAPEATP